MRATSISPLWFVDQLAALTECNSDRTIEPARLRCFIKNQDEVSVKGRGLFPEPTNVGSRIGLCIETLRCCIDFSTSITNFAVQYSHMTKICYFSERPESAFYTGHAQLLCYAAFCKLHYVFRVVWSNNLNGFADMEGRYEEFRFRNCIASTGSCLRPRMGRRSCRCRHLQLEGFYVGLNAGLAINNSEYTLRPTG